MSWNVLNVLWLTFLSLVYAIDMWTGQQIVTYMTQHPNRAYFSHLFSKGGFRTGMEVGVASGRFSELFLVQCESIGPWNWFMVDPNIIDSFYMRFPDAPLIGGGIGALRNGTDSDLSWEKRGIGKNAKKVFIQDYSTADSCLKRVAGLKFDFIYLDGAHDYENVKKELPIYWDMVKPGGVLAGHDYCNWGEKTQKSCPGCEDIPKCRPYTAYGAGKKATRGHLSANQHGVVLAVQQWAVTHPELRVYHTVENFTRASLAADGLDYDLVITATYNPSWFFVKPMK